MFRRSSSSSRSRGISFSSKSLASEQTGRRTKIRWFGFKATFEWAAVVNASQTGLSPTTLHQPSSSYGVDALAQLSQRTIDLAHLTDELARIAEHTVSPRGGFSSPGGDDHDHDHDAEAVEETARGRRGRLGTSSSSLSKAADRLPVRRPPVLGFEPLRELNELQHRTNHFLDSFCLVDIRYADYAIRAATPDLLRGQPKVGGLFLSDVLINEIDWSDEGFGACKSQPGYLFLRHDVFRAVRIERQSGWERRARERIGAEQVPELRLFSQIEVSNLDVTTETVTGENQDQVDGEDGDDDDEEDDNEEEEDEEPEDIEGEDVWLWLAARELKKMGREDKELSAFVAEMERSCNQHHRYHPRNRQRHNSRHQATSSSRSSKKKVTTSSATTERRVRIRCDKIEAIRHFYELFFVLERKKTKTSAFSAGGGNGSRFEVRFLSETFSQQAFEIEARNLVDAFDAGCFANIEPLLERRQRFFFDLRTEAELRSSASQQQQQLVCCIPMRGLEVECWLCFVISGPLFARCIVEN